MRYEGTLHKARLEKRRLVGAPPASRRAAEPRPAAETDAPPPAAPRTLHEHVTEMIRVLEPTCSPRTVLNWHQTYKRWILRPLGSVPLVEIDRRLLDGWLADVLREATSHRASDKALGMVKRFLSKAVEWKLIDANPAAGMRVPDREEQETNAERVLGAAQVAQLLDDPNLSLRIESLLRAAIEGCLRSAELSGLKWPDINLAEGTIRIRRQVYYDRIGKQYLTTNLKGRRARTIKIGAAFRDCLRDWNTESVAAGADPCGYVWPGNATAHMADGSAAQAVERCLQRRDLIDADGKPLVTLHGLRHTGASLLFARNVPLIVISRHLGHKSPQVTALVYAHLIDDSQLDLVAEAFDEMHAPAPVPIAATNGRLRGRSRRARRAAA